MEFIAPLMEFQASYHVRIISYDSRSHCTPPLNPLPLPRGGETKRSFGGVGFFGFNKQSSGHDIIHEYQRLINGVPSLIHGVLISIHEYQRLIVAFQNISPLPPCLPCSRTAPFYYSKTA